MATPQFFLIDRSIFKLQRSSNRETSVIHIMLCLPPTRQELKSGLNVCKSVQVTSFLGVPGQCQRLDLCG